MSMYVDNLFQWFMCFATISKATPVFSIFFCDQRLFAFGILFRIPAFSERCLTPELPTRGNSLQKKSGRTEEIALYILMSLNPKGEISYPLLTDIVIFSTLLLYHTKTRQYEAEFRLSQSLHLARGWACGVLAQ